MVSIQGATVQRAFGGLSRPVSSTLVLSSLLVVVWDQMEEGPRLQGMKLFNNLSALTIRRHAPLRTRGESQAGQHIRSGLGHIYFFS